MPEENPTLKFAREKARHNFDLQVTTLAEVRKGFVESGQPTRIKHAFFLFFHATAGFGSYFVDFETYTLQKGDTLFLGQGQVHVMGDEPELEGYMILFTPEFLEKGHPVLKDSPLFNHYLYSPLLPAAAAPSVLPDLFDIMNEEFQHSNSHNLEPILRNYLELIVLKAEESSVYASNPAIDDRYYQEFHKFKNLVHAHFKTTRNVKDIAKMMGRSTKKVNALCRMFTEFSAKEFIDQRVTLEIKRLLATQDISVKELTWELGFAEPTNLVKFFKRQTGFTPGQYSNK